MLIHGPFYETEKEGFYRGLANGRGHFIFWTYEERQHFLSHLIYQRRNKLNPKGYWAGYRQGLKEAVAKRKKY